jgi:hypothetical protein
MIASQARIRALARNHHGHNWRSTQRVFTTNLSLPARTRRGLCLGRYLVLMIPACPTCGSPGVPLLFGRPIPEARLAAQDNRLALAGCMVPEDPPNWQCAQRHQWQGGSDADRQALILSILQAYGYDYDDE